MATTSLSGPVYTVGSMATVLAATFGQAVPEHSAESGPNASYQGEALLDPRYFYPKDQVTGYTGRIPAYLTATLRSTGAIPAAFAVNNIAAAANVVTATAMTLAGNSVGVMANTPVLPFSAQMNSGTPSTALTLDPGFCFGNCTSGSVTITVSNSTDFLLGMPLVIGGVGNAGGTIPLLTNVATIASATTITVTVAPLATNAAAPIATGNLWGPNPNWYSTANELPTAILPFLAGGAGLFLDPRQSIARGVSITGSASATGGNFTVSGLDIYGQPMTQTITAGAGATVAYSTKAFKYIISVTPAFTDAHNYSVGTSDVFGLHYFATAWDDLTVSWNSASMAASTGFTAGVTATASATTGDVRGTVQASAQGGGSGIGANNSNGTVSSLLMSGRRLTINQTLTPRALVFSTPATAVAMFGNVQV